MTRKLRVGLTVAATVGLLVSGMSAAATAQPGSVGTASPASMRLQVATLHASTTKFPTSQTHATGGAVNLTEAGTLQRYANVSNSPRPSITRTANGNTVLRNPSAVSWLPTVTPTAVSGTRPNVGKGWQGLDEFANQKYAGFSLEPPDQGLCAGNGFVFELINDVVRVYGTTGVSQGTAYLNDFFQEPAYQFTTDPSCVYDAASGRFIAAELTLDVDPSSGNLTGQNWLDLAVSKTGDPTGGYNIYRINVTDDGTSGTPSHTSCPCIGDFPHLATDANGVFLTTNEYPFSGPGIFGNNFNGAQVYALSKAATVSGASSVAVVHFENTRIPSTTGPREAGFTLWPAQSAGNAYASEGNGTIYFASSLAAEEARPDDFSGHGNQIGLWWIANTASLNSTPHLQLRVKTITVGSYGIPPLANQKAGSVPLKDCLNVGCRPNVADPYAPEQEGGLDSSDTRPLTAYYAHGVVYSALDTAMTVAGNVQSGFEWFAVNASRATSTLSKSGYVGVAHNNVTFPAIATDTYGDGYIGMTLSGDSYYPSAVYASWPKGMSSTIHIAASGSAPQDGFCEYLEFNCAQTPTPAIRPRWGDYGYAAWDGTQFYVANEYIAHSCDFTTFNADTTCGNHRTFFGNFATHIQVLH